MADTFHIHELFKQEFPNEEDHRLKHAFTMGYLHRHEEQIKADWNEYMKSCKKNKLGSEIVMSNPAPNEYRDVEMNLEIDGRLEICSVDFVYDKGQKGSFHQEEIKPKVEIQDAFIYSKNKKLIRLLSEFISDPKGYDEAILDLEQQGLQYLEDMKHEC